MTSEELAVQLASVCGANLRSVILFGSAAAGDHPGGQSDRDVLIVLDRINQKDLQAIAPIVRKWHKQRNPAPLIFDAEDLQRSADVFPIEMADLKDSRRVLYGEDVVQPMTVQKEHLRRSLEHELKGKLLQLRRQYLLVAGQSRATRQLLIQSLSTFLVLMRATLRLYQDRVPAKKLEALEELGRHIPANIEAFKAVASLKAGARLSAAACARLLDDYLQAIESVVKAVDNIFQTKA